LFCIINSFIMNKAILTIATSILIFTETILSPANAQNIGQRTFHFKDEARKRPVTTEVWYPTTDPLSPKKENGYPFTHIQTIRNGTVPNQKFPLILISHGTGGGRITLEWLADKLVQNGFIVASIDHYGNTYDNKIAEDFVEPWKRPLDISFALTSLLKDTLFGSRIDTARIGAAGFSIGGYTVLSLAGAKLNFNAIQTYFDTPGGKKEANIPEFPGIDKMIGDQAIAESFKNSPDLKDGRIRAFFAICPSIGQGFVKREQFAAIMAPVYIVGAQSDSIAPVKTNAAHYHELIKGSKLMIVPGKAGHYVFLNEAVDEIKKQQPFIFADDPTVSRHSVHEQVSQLAVDFFKDNLK
jgi:predicted dienelactone hydrolase